MKKILTMSALAAVLSLPAMAQIANNATCNNTNLGQSANNSTANVEANWNANTININWYNGDTKITSNTCTYDGAITLPPQPTKPGYTFAGWRLRAVPTGPNCSAISNETTCNNTEGCFYRNYYNEGCHSAIPVEDAPYNSCSEITDEDTCLSIRPTGNGSFPVCQWDGTCSQAWLMEGAGMTIPQSWCNQDYEAGLCYNDD